jgi:sulfide:quinone oxidoreductase
MARNEMSEPMSKIRQIAPHFAVTGALRAEDFAEIAAAGFKSIVSNLPDGESATQLTGVEEARLAARHGLGFRHIPTTKLEVFSDRVVGGVSEALRELPGPVLAHCASGLRSVVAWAAAAARVQPADRVVSVLEAAGFDLRGIRDELEAQRDPSDTGAIPPALDASSTDG